MREFLVGAIAVLLFCAATRADMPVNLGEKVQLQVTDTGAVCKVTIADKDVSAVQPGGFSVVEILPPDGKTTDAEPIVGKFAPAGGGKFDFTGNAEKTKLDLKAKWICDDNGLTISGELLNPDPARAVQLDFLLPIQCEGWTYQTGIECAEKIGKASATGDTNPADRDCWLHFGDTTKPDLLKVSNLWFNTISDGTSGVALGIAPDAPVPFMIARNKQGLYIRFYLGLSSLTEKFPNKAAFKFVVYGIDGRWGIRSATERFYKMFPGFFARRATKFGTCASTNEILKNNTANRQDFGFTFGENDFQWTDGKYAPEVAPLIKELGLNCFHWREPWSYFLTGSDPKKTPAEEVQLLKDQAAGKTEDKPHGQMCGAPMKDCLE